MLTKEEQRKLKNAFMAQRSRCLPDNPKRRYQPDGSPIEWQLTFEEWLSIWQESGKLAERSKTGYCMSRKEDKGPYAVGNVFIQTIAENTRQAQLGRAKPPRTEEHKKKLSDTLKAAYEEGRRS